MKIGVLSDLHCGHLNGIATPAHQQTEDAEGAWKLFLKWNRCYGPFDHMFVLGDCIDGNSSKNGGVDCITTDRSKQADIAIQVLEKVSVKRNATWTFAGGTPYHTGNQEDFERIIASSFGAEVSDVAWCDVGKKRFRLRHKINRAMNNLNKQLDTHERRIGGGRELQADMLLYGHLHMFKHECRVVNCREMHAVICPALQGHTGYGGRMCDGDVDIGALCIEITDGRITLHKHITPLSMDTWGNAKKKGLL